MTYVPQQFQQLVLQTNVNVESKKCKGNKLAISYLSIIRTVILNVHNAPLYLSQLVLVDELSHGGIRTLRFKDIVGRSKNSP